MFKQGDLVEPTTAAVAFYSSCIEKLSQSISLGNEPAMRRFEVRYEATAFTDNVSDLDATCSEQESLGFTETCLKEKTFPQGVVGVVGGYVSADDHQGVTNIHAFVSVTLLIDAETKQQAESMAVPEGVLTKVADMMASANQGLVSLSLEAHSWEVVDVDEVAVATFPTHQVSPRRKASGMSM